MPLSYNGWAASPDPDAIGINTEWEPIPGHRFPGGVKAGDVETVLTYFVRQLDARVEPIDRDAVKDEWGWAYRASVNSPDKLSCHASGTAFDYNATRHPNGHRGTFTAAQVAKIREIQAEVGGVVRWLGDATRIPDEMHFEVDGTPAEVAAVAARLRDEEDDLDKTEHGWLEVTTKRVRLLEDKVDEIHAALFGKASQDPSGNIAARLDVTYQNVKDIEAKVDKIIAKLG